MICFLFSPLLEIIPSVRIAVYARVYFVLGVMYTPICL